MKLLLNCLARLAAAALTGAALVQAAPPASVGDPHTPGALAGSLQEAYAQGARKIAIRPGTYLLPNVGHTAITLAGLTLSQNKNASYQGRITAVGKDENGKDYCGWKPDAGYPVPPEHEKGFLGGDVNVVDARTRLFKVGTGDFYGVSYRALEGGTFRAQMHGGEAGDWLVGRCGEAPFKVYLSGCRDCTVKDVTLVRSGFAPLREENGDGMHMTGAFSGPDIEHCVFQGLFLDDCIATHGYLQTITAVAGPALTLKGGIGALKAGGLVRVSSAKGFFGKAKVVSIKDNGDGTAAVVLDKDLGVPPGAKLSSPLADGAGYKILGCRLGNTRARGTLAKAGTGLIEDNVIEGCGQATISLGPEYDWGEADSMRNVTMQNNTIRGNGRCAYGGGAVPVHGDGALGNRGIIIQGNRFSSNCQEAIDIHWADGVTIAGNRITEPLVLPIAVSRRSRWQTPVPSH